MRPCQRIEQPKEKDQASRAVIKMLGGSAQKKDAKKTLGGTEMSAGRSKRRVMNREKMCSRPSKGTRGEKDARPRVSSS